MLFGNRVLNAVTFTLWYKCYDALCIQSFKEFLWILIVSFWKSLTCDHHVLCTTELHCQFLSPVVADYIFDCFGIFWQSEWRWSCLYLCPAGIRGDRRCTYTHSSRWGEWSASRLGRCTLRGKSLHCPLNGRQGRSECWGEEGNGKFTPSI